MLEQHLAETRVDMLKHLNPTLVDRVKMIEDYLDDVRANEHKNKTEISHEHQQQVHNGSGASASQGTDLHDNAPSLTAGLADAASKYTDGHENEFLHERLAHFRGELVALNRSLNGKISKTEDEMGNNHALGLLVDNLHCRTQELSREIADQNNDAADIRLENTMLMDSITEFECGLIGTKDTMQMHT